MVFYFSIFVICIFCVYFPVHLVLGVSKKNIAKYEQTFGFCKVLRVNDKIAYK